MSYTKEQVIEISNATADRHNLPRLMMLACGVAESNLKWDARRPHDPDKDRQYWPDVSGGVWQQTVRWSQEHRDSGGDASYPGDEQVERILHLYYNVEHSANTAVKQLKHYFDQENGDILNALCRYNKPMLPPESNPNRSNYARGMVEAERLLDEVNPFQQFSEQFHVTLIGSEMVDPLDNRSIQFQDSIGDFGLLLEESKSPGHLYVYWYDKTADWSTP